MEVEYRDIEGFPNYRVGSDGTVWSRKGPGTAVNDEWRLLKLQPYGRYLRAALSLNNKTIKQSVHAIVLKAFIGPRPPKSDGCHKDGNPHNNAVDNLKWGTRAENEADKVLHGRSNRGSRQGASKLKEADIPIIRELLKQKVPQHVIANRFGVGRGAISQIAINRTWAHLKTEGVDVGSNEIRRNAA